VLCASGGGRVLNIGKQNLIGEQRATVAAIAPDATESTITSVSTQAGTVATIDI